MGALEYGLDLFNGESSNGRIPKMSHEDDFQYKSKNLQAERRRREKLDARLRALRALVPKITNMNKATIIEDAIGHIQELQWNVKALSDELAEMEASDEKQPTGVVDIVEETNGIEKKVDVEVSQISGNKLWINMSFEKNRGEFVKVMEVVATLGFELTHTSATTSRGVMLVTLCVQSLRGEMPTAQQTKEVFLSVLKNYGT